MKEVTELIIGLIMALLFIGSLIYASNKSQDKYKEKCQNANGSVIVVGDNYTCLSIVNNKIVEIK